MYTYSSIGSGGWYPLHGGYSCSCCGPEPAGVVFLVPAPRHEEEHEHEKNHTHIPMIETVDPVTPTKSILIGGERPAHLALEYVGIAASPVVKVTITGPGGTTNWDDSSFASGYHLKTDFAAVAPGTVVTITVQNAIARLRWREFFNW